MTEPPTFTTREVCRAFAIERPRLQSWWNLGHLRWLQTKQPGPGKATRFPIGDVVQMRLMMLMEQVGIPLLVAAYYAKEAFVAMDQSSPEHVRELQIRYFLDGRPPQARFNDDASLDPAAPGAAITITVNLLAAIDDARDRLTNSWNQVPGRSMVTKPAELVSVH